MARLQLTTDHEMLRSPREVLLTDIVVGSRLLSLQVQQSADGHDGVLASCNATPRTPFKTVTRAWTQLRCFVPPCRLHESKVKTSGLLRQGGDTMASFL